MVDCIHRKEGAAQADLEVEGTHCPWGAGKQLNTAGLGRGGRGDTHQLGGLLEDLKQVRDLD